VNPASGLKVFSALSTAAGGYQSIGQAVAVLVAAGDRATALALLAAVVPRTEDAVVAEPAGVGYHAALDVLRELTALAKEAVGRAGRGERHARADLGTTMTSTM